MTRVVIQTPVARGSQHFSWVRGAPWEEQKTDGTGLGSMLSQKMYMGRSRDQQLPVLPSNLRATKDHSRQQASTGAVAAVIVFAMPLVAYGTSFLFAPVQHLWPDRFAPVLTLCDEPQSWPKEEPCSESHQFSLLNFSLLVCSIRVIICS